MLTDEIESIYKKYKTEHVLSDFTGISKEVIEKAERKLNVTLPDNYKVVLLRWGLVFIKEIAPLAGPIDIYEMQAEANIIY